MRYLQLMAKVTGGSLLGIFAVQLIIGATLFFALSRIRGLGFLGAAWLTYFWVGFLTLGLPLTLAVPETTFVGTLWLSLAWPAWLYLPLTGHTIAPPPWLAVYMFA